MKQLKITQSITNRQGTSFDKYCTEVSKEDMITADEETELARTVRLQRIRGREMKAAQRHAGNQVERRYLRVAHRLQCHDFGMDDA